MTVVAYWWAW